MIVPLTDLSVYEAIRDFFATEEGLSPTAAKRAYSDQKLAMMEEVDYPLFQQYAKQAADWLEAKIEEV
jgi:hypothetical protein